MKTILILGGLFLMAGAAAFYVGHSGADHYGNKFRGYPAVDLGDLVDRPSEFLRKDVTIHGTIVRQCPSSGCWFILRNAGAKELKVEMGDTTPKLPQRGGKTATVEGRLIPYGSTYEFIGTGVEFR
jgi:hypothetical protein